MAEKPENPKDVSPSPDVQKFSLNGPRINGPPIGNVKNILPPPPPPAKKKQ